MRFGGPQAHRLSQTPRGSETAALILKELPSRERQRAGVFPKTFKHPREMVEPDGQGIGG